MCFLIAPGLFPQEVKQERGNKKRKNKETGQSKLEAIYVIRIEDEPTQGLEYVHDIKCIKI